MNELFYSTGQAAKELGVGVVRLRRLCESRTVRAEQTEGGQWRIPDSELQRLKREGVPQAPRPLPNSAPAPRSTRSPRNHPTLLADPSPEVVDSAEQVVRLENEVKTLDLKKQLVEKRDWFTDRARREEQRRIEHQAALDRETEQAQARKRRQAWQSEWEERGLSYVPHDAPGEIRLEAHHLIQDTLQRVGPDTPDWSVDQLVQAAIGSALAPWRLSEHKEAAVRQAATAYEAPWNAWSDSSWVTRAETAARRALQSFGETNSDHQMRETAIAAVRPLFAEYRHQKRCKNAFHDMRFELSGASQDELEAAKVAIENAVSGLQPDTSEQQFKSVCAAAIAETVAAIEARKEQTRRRQQKAADGTKALVTTLLNAPLISRALAMIPDELRVLARHWELGDSVDRIARRIYDSIRDELTHQVTGTESGDQLARLVRRLIRDELGLYD